MCIRDRTWCIITNAYSESLKKAFDSYSNNFLGSELVFACGANTFKLEKSLLNKHTLYWKSGLDWNKLPNLVVKDTGITLTGLVLNGHLPSKVLNITVDLPIYNGSKNPNKYFTLVNTGKNYPLKLTVDFYHSSMTTTNQLDAPHQFTFNREQYLNDQKEVHRPKEFLTSLDEVWNKQTALNALESKKDLYSNSFLYKDEISKLILEISEAKRQLNNAKQKKQIEEEKERQREQQENILRLQEITEAADRYRDGLVLTIPSGSYKDTHYCALIE